MPHIPCFTWVNTPRVLRSTSCTAQPINIGIGYQNNTLVDLYSHYQIGKNDLVCSWEHLESRAMNRKRETQTENQINQDYRQTNIAYSSFQSTEDNRPTNPLPTPSCLCIPAARIMHQIETYCFKTIFSQLVSQPRTTPLQAPSNPHSLYLLFQPNLRCLWKISTDGHAHTWHWCPSFMTQNLSFYEQHCPSFRLAARCQIRARGKPRRGVDEILRVRRKAWWCNLRMWWSWGTKSEIWTCAR